MAALLLALLSKHFDMLSDEHRMRAPALMTVLFLTAAVSAVLLCGCDRAAKSVDYSTASSISIQLGKENRESGLRLVSGRTNAAPVASSIHGTACQSIRLGNQKEEHIYFVMDSTFKKAGVQRVRIQVEYFDATPGEFDVVFDGERGKYADTSRRAILQRSLKWETADFDIRRGRFQNSQDFDADFCLRIRTPEFFVRRVIVYRESGEIGEGMYAHASSVSITFGKVNEENGIVQTHDFADGITYPAIIDGVECREIRPARRAYVYMIIDPSFKRTNGMDAILSLEYYDGAFGQVQVHYDAWGSAYALSPATVVAKDTKTWQTAEFKLSNARFANMQNSEADFRIQPARQPFHVRRITVRRDK